MNTQHEVANQSTIIKAAYPNWFYTGLYGSQNYNCSWAGSDVDTKSILGLSFSQLIQRKDVNNSVATIPGSTENLADVKDVHSMFGNFLKSNINFLEILCTDFFTYDPALRTEVMQMRSMVNQCAYYNMKQLIHATVGQFRMKCAALEKPFESKLPLIEKYGYDPKQLASAYRLLMTTPRLIDQLPFKQAIDLTEYSSTIVGIKSNPPSLEAARASVAEWTETMNEYIDLADLMDNLYESPLAQLQQLEEDIYRILLRREIIKEEL